MASNVVVRVPDDSPWSLQELPLGPGVRRGAAALDLFVGRLADEKRLELVQVSELQPAPRRGAVEPSAGIIVEAETAADELHVLMVRHSSGAITFHLPSEQPAVRRGGARKTIRFFIAVPEGPALEGEATRRGILSKVIRTFLLKVTGKVADFVMAKLGRLWEKAAWKIAKRKEGWKQVTGETLQSKLREADFGAISSEASRPNLLLLHGTFSHAAAAFRHLATTQGSDGRTFFASMAPLYDGRIFAFDHFTISRTPEENVKMLLEALPKRGCVFDVITHSRGGLVLRHVVEMQNALSARFALRHAVLVASPNEGTPLASPARFELFVTWIANLLDFLPDNPLTTGISFVSEALAWLVHRAVGGLPGLAAMDSGGAGIQALQGPGSPHESAYSALVSNYEPSNLLQRMADTGVDIFFGSANDLVVPTEGGWRVDPGSGTFIPGGRIGCYGRGGNLPEPNEDQVSHVSFFKRPETVDFLVRALKSESHPLPELNPSEDLPYLLRRRAAALAEAQPVPAAPPEARFAPVAPVAAPAPSPAVVTPMPGGRAVTSFTDEVFYLSVLDAEGGSATAASKREPETAILMATFRNARAVEILQMEGGEAGTRFSRIKKKHKAIRDYVNGVAGATEMPHDQSVIELGRDLFAALFPGDIRRLYDVARAEQANRRINVIFTSQIAWVPTFPGSLCTIRGGGRFWAPRRSISPAM